MKVIKHSFFAIAASGLFGGDSDKAKGGVADELIREMKKRGLAGDKRK